MREYAIYLVNNTDAPYERVVSFTGMFASVDDGLLDSTKARRDLAPLPPRSVMMLEDGDAQLTILNILREKRESPARPRDDS